jgi:hypothetical protein
VQLLCYDEERLASGGNDARHLIFPLLVRQPRHLLFGAKLLCILRILFVLVAADAVRRGGRGGG